MIACEWRIANVARSPELLAAGIGHELRNPLGVVESSAFLVARRLEQLGVSDPTLTRHVDKIAVEVKRSNKTINDLLELARARRAQARGGRRPDGPGTADEVTPGDELSVPLPAPGGLRAVPGRGEAQAN